MQALIYAFASDGESVVRTCKDAKAMAKSLRASLAARRVFVSHGECLEMVAKQFGFVDWNTLSARLNVESELAAPKQVSCSFCGKSHHDVRSLIEGGCSNHERSPCAFICDECVELCAQINTERRDEGRHLRG